VRVNWGYRKYREEYALGEIKAELQRFYCCYDVSDNTYGEYFVALGMQSAFKEAFIRQNY
jgi:hypothetical protein